MDDYWEDVDEAEESAENVAEIFKNAGMIPSVLLEKYKSYIANSDFSCVEAFFRKLSELSPDILKLFS